MSSISHCVCCCAGSLPGGPSLDLLPLTHAQADGVTSAFLSPFVAQCAAGVPVWAQELFRTTVGEVLAGGHGPPPRARVGDVHYIPPWLAAIPEQGMHTLPALECHLAHSLFRCMLRCALLVAYGEDGKGDGSNAVWDLGLQACVPQRDIEAQVVLMDAYYAYVELAALQAAALDVLLAGTLAQDAVCAEEEARIENAAEPLAKEVMEIVNLKCPRCGQAFVDFIACCALPCSRHGCGCHFCAYWCVLSPLANTSRRHRASSPTPHHSYFRPFCGHFIPTLYNPPVPTRPVTPPMYAVCRTVGRMPTPTYCSVH